MFRQLPYYNIRNVNAISLNYFVCFLLGCLLIGKIPFNAKTLQADWFPFAAYLSLCFIIFFNVNAITTQRVGMIITSIFQKLSLVFPVVVGVFFFGESLSLSNKLAIPLCIAAIILSNFPNRKALQNAARIRKYWYLPLLVLFGSGLIEVSLFYAQEREKIGFEGLQFTSTLFGMAGLWGLLFLGLKKQLNFSRNEILGGIFIGVPNFFTIYLIIKALELGWDGSVLFPVNNVGTIFFTAVLGLLVFREKLSTANYAGLILALLSVLLFSLK